MSKFGTKNPPAGSTTSCRQSGKGATAAAMSITVVTPCGKGNGGRLSTCSVPALLVRVMRCSAQHSGPGMVVVVVLVVVVVVVVGTVVVVVDVVVVVEV